MTGFTAPVAQLSINPWDDFRQMIQFHFMANTLLAGSMAALSAALVGYFLVLRSQTFAGHALAHAGFTGAAAALLAGVAPIAGLLAAGLASAVGMGAIEGRDGEETGSGVAIGAVLAFVLGLGLLFLQLYPGQAEDAYAILFGGVLGITDGDVLTVAVVSAVTLLVLTVVGRPLLLASFDPKLAEARGVPVAWLSILFYVLLAFVVAEAVQVIGILLIFALLVAPAATAQCLTARLLRGLLASVALGLLFLWMGIGLAFFVDPFQVVGFDVTSVAFGTYLLVRLSAGARAKLTRDRPRVYALSEFGE